MGLLKPKWISDKWWAGCPFNYCDHFGDKLELSKFCIICKEEVLEDHNLEHDYKIRKVSQELWDKSVSKKKFEIKVRKSYTFGDFENPDEVPLVNLINHYGAYIEKTMDELSSIPEEADIKFVNTAIDILGHSRNYAHTKIMRAYDSALKELRKTYESSDPDSKTSALFAYVAIKRNSRAFLALSKHKPLATRRDQYLKLAATSLEICDLIQRTFFPGDELQYEEFGCDYFRNIEETKNDNRLID